MSYGSIQIANEFLKIANKHNKEITPLKMQKLVYFAHGWCLAILNKPLIDEQVEAWKFGPVISSLYHEFKKYGNRPITKPGRDIYFDFCNLETGESPNLEISDSEVLQLLDKIWEVYGGFTPMQLSQMTHEEGTPWKNVFNNDLPRNTDIPAEAIKDYFVKKINDS